MGGYFYITKNLVNGKFYYGSSTIGNENSYYGSNELLRKARIKYGDANFEHIPLRYFATREEAFQFEDRFLKLYEISKNHMSYNMKDAGKGGATMTGKKHKKESKEKIRESNIQSWKNPELKHRQSIKTIELNERGIIGMKGKQHKPESIEKIRKSNTGRSPSDDVRKIISEKTKEGMSKMSKEKRLDSIDKANSNRARNMELRKDTLKMLIDENPKLSYQELFELSGFTHRTFLGLINKIKLEDEKYTNI